MSAWAADMAQLKALREKEARIRRFLSEEYGIPPASQLADDLAAAEERGYQRAIADLRGGGIVMAAICGVDDACPGKFSLGVWGSAEAEDLTKAILRRAADYLTAKAGQTTAPTPPGADQ